MLLKRKLRSAMTLSTDDWAFFLHAFIFLGTARLAILLLPFRWIASSLGAQQQETASGGLSIQEKTIVRRVAVSIQRASRYTPWNSNCLAQAITANRLLKQHNVASTLYLGLTKPAHKPALDKAHAWVRSGRFYVVGGNGALNYCIVATFATETVKSQ